MSMSVRLLGLWKPLFYQYRQEYFYANIHHSPAYSGELYNIYALFQGQPLKQKYLQPRNLNQIKTVVFTLERND